MSLVNLLPWQIAAMTQSQIAALTADDFASMSVAQLHHLSAAQFSWLSSAQIGWIPSALVNYIAPAVFAALDPAVVAQFSVAQLAALRPSQALVMTAAEAAALTPDAVAALTLPVVKNLGVAALQALNGLTLAQACLLPPAVIGDLSAAQFAAIVAPNVSAFGAGRFGFVTAAQAATLTVAQANALTVGKLEALSAAAIAGLSPAVLAGLRPALVEALTAAQLNGIGAALAALDAGLLTAAQLAALDSAAVGALTATQLNALGAAGLSALNPAFLTDAQAGELTAATIGALSTQAFDALLGSHLASLSTAALAGVSIADLASLTATQLASFTSAQIAAMSAAQAAFVTGLNPVIADLAAHETNGTLSYAGALAVLQDAAAGGMTASKFSALTAIADSLASGAIGASNYVAQIFGDVVLGNSANAWWTGGATTSVALGDLSAASSQTQVDELIGKWFLGTDQPNPTVSGWSGVPVSYQADTDPLYGAGGAPQLVDVNQGATGDCYFLATLAEMAQQDPTAIENMIRSDGNGAYSVEFQVQGQPDYVTVDSLFPTLGGGWTIGNGQTTVFADGYGTLWAPLLEKAWAQLNEQTAAMHWAAGVVANSYQDISGGWADCVSEMTQQSVTDYALGASDAASYVSQIFGIFQTALAQGQLVEMGTGAAVPAGSDLVADHMFAVLGVNVAAATVELYNPWGKNGGSLPAEFTASAAVLGQDGVDFAVTSGKSVMG